MKKTLWALLDDRVGSVGQARGVLQVLEKHLDITEKQLVYTKWAKLPNFIKGRSLIGIDTQNSAEINAPFPDIVLSTSRRTTPVARLIKKQSKGKTKIVQLMFPGNTGIRDIDLIIVPEHDTIKHKNEKFFTVTGCPHRVTPQKLKEAEDKWADVFADLPRPFTSVIIGGSIKGKPFSKQNAEDLAMQIKQLHNKLGGSLLITTSRRTGEEAQNIIMNKLTGIPMHTFLWGEKKENPYMGYLACADKILITGDSVSMCSEACGTGKPILIFEGHNWLTPKHLRFTKSLFSGGFATPVYADNALDFEPSKTLNTAELIAGKILEIR